MAVEVNTKTFELILELAAGYSEADFKAEVQGTELVRDMLNGALDARGAEEFQIQDFANLLRVGVNYAIPRKLTVLKEFGLGSGEVSEFEERLRAFEAEHGRRETVVGHSVLRIYGESRMKTWPQSDRQLAPFLASTRELMNEARRGEPDAAGKRAADLRERYRRAFVDQKRPKYVGARAVGVLLYPLAPDAFFLANNWISPALEALVGSPANTFEEYYEAIEPLTEVLTRLRLPRHFGVLDRLLDALKQRLADPGTMAIPNGITKDDVLAAMGDFDEGIEHGFLPSTKLDLLHDGRRYPPKAIVGLAARRILGRVLAPSEFSGGRDSRCVRILTDLGFSIVPKERVVPVGASDLPEQPTANVWVEQTYSRHEHGGKGWEFGRCLWSPATADGGADLYSLMREPRPGDIVVHVQDSAFHGHSLVAEQCEETTTEPPVPGTWGGRPAYYRIPLKAYAAVPQPYPVAAFLQENQVAITEELASDSPKYYPFMRYGDSLRPRQGGYISRCTERLYKLIRKSIFSGGAPPPEAFTIDDAMRDLFMDQSLVEHVLELLRTKMNVILQGPPGVGKTFVAKRIAYALMGAKDDDRLQMVQFHQSYTYEDFIQGYRPSKDGGFARKDGAFHTFCTRAADEPDHPYVFIIGEINRGNLSKILGEMMMLIEHDKRGPRWAIPLAYHEDGDAPFFVPNNVHILGLMNTADRSLAMVDYALRRRFAFQDLRPAFDSDAFQSHLGGFGADEELVDAIRRNIGRLNARIEEDKDLGWGYCIGHSFFCPERGVEEVDAEWYSKVITNEIAPLLREYWFDKPESFHSDRLADLRQV